MRTRTGPLVPLDLDLAGPRNKVGLVVSDDDVDQASGADGGDDRDEEDD